MKSIFTPFSSINKTYLYILFIIQAILTLVFWQFNTPELIPQPYDVIKAFLNFFQDRTFYENLSQSLVLTFKAMFYSIIIASLIGYTSTIPFFNGLAQFIIKLRYLTLVGLIFIFTILLSTGAMVKVSLLMFGIIPFFVLSLLSVIEKIDQKEYDLCKTIGFNNWQTLWELVIVGRADQIIETIRANFAISWLMITMVETFSMSEGGIGVMLYSFNKYNRLDEILALQFVIFGLGVFFDYILSKAREIFFPYTKIKR